jgi:hypothetical protein
MCIYTTVSFATKLHGLYRCLSIEQWQNSMQFCVCVCEHARVCDELGLTDPSHNLNVCLINWHTHTHMRAHRAEWIRNIGCLFGSSNLWNISNNNIKASQKIKSMKVCIFLDFELSPCSECSTLSVWWFPAICSLHADISEHSVCSIIIDSVSRKNNRDDTPVVFKWGNGLAQERFGSKTAWAKQKNCDTTPFLPHTSTSALH